MQCGNILNAEAARISREQRIANGCKNTQNAIAEWWHPNGYTMLLYLKGDTRTFGLPRFGPPTNVSGLNEEWQRGKLLFGRDGALVHLDPCAWFAPFDGGTFVMHVDEYGYVRAYIPGFTVEYYFGENVVAAARNLYV